MDDKICVLCTMFFFQVQLSIGSGGWGCFQLLDEKIKSQLKRLGKKVEIDNFMWFSKCFLK